MNSNTLSSNLERIKSATDDIRTAVGLDETNTIEEVATAVEEAISGGGDKDIYKVEEIGDLEYLSAEENDLAMVAKEIYTPLTESFTGGEIVPVEQVTYDTPIEDYYYISGMLENGDINISIGPQQAEIRYMNWQEDTDISINYTTEDSLTYVINGSSESFVVDGIREFFEFSDIAAQLVTIKNNDFAGIFQLQNQDVIRNYTIVNNDKCLVNRTGNFMHSNACLYIALNPEFGTSHILTNAAKLIQVNPIGIEQLRIYFKNNELHIINNYQNNYSNVYITNGLEGNSDSIDLGSIGTDTLLAENINDIVFILEPDFVNWGNIYTIYADDINDNVLIELDCEASLVTELMWKNYNIGTTASANNIFTGKTAYTSYGVVEGKFDRDRYEQRYLLYGVGEPTFKADEDIDNQYYTYLELNQKPAGEVWFDIVPNEYKGFATVEVVNSITNNSTLDHEYEYFINNHKIYKLNLRNGDINEIKTLSSSKTAHYAYNDNFVFYTYEKDNILYILNVNDNTEQTISLASMPGNSNLYPVAYCEYDNTVVIQHNQYIWKYDIDNDNLYDTTKTCTAALSGQKIGDRACLTEYNNAVDLIDIKSYYLGVPYQQKTLGKWKDNLVLFMTINNVDTQEINVGQWNSNTNQYEYIGDIWLNDTVPYGGSGIARNVYSSYDSDNDILYYITVDGTSRNIYKITNAQLYWNGTHAALSIMLFNKGNKILSKINMYDYLNINLCDAVMRPSDYGACKVNKIWRCGLINDTWTWYVVKDYTIGLEEEPGEE